MQYNNGFPVNYPQFNYSQFQQPYQQIGQAPYMPQIQQQNQPINNMPIQNQNAVLAPKFDVVQGELAASMYPTENGQEVILMDMDNPFAYHKKRNIDGKLEPMKKFRLVEVTEEKKPDIDLKEYVKQEEIESLIEKAVRNEVEKRLSDLTLKPSPKKKVEE